MGTSTSAAQLAGKLHGLARDMADTRVPLNATALHVKGLFQASASAAGALGTRVAGGRKVIGVRYDIKGSGMTATAIINYTGPAHLLNNPTRPHRIEPRGRRGRRRGKRALTINGSVRAWANHPGTRGKHFYEKARVAAERTAPRVYARAGLTEPLRRNF